MPDTRDATLTDVAMMMATHHVHCVAVVGISHEQPECFVWSIISDLDLVWEGLAAGTHTTARAIATEPIVVVDPRMPLREAAREMLVHGVATWLWPTRAPGAPLESCRPAISPVVSFCRLDDRPIRVHDPIVAPGVACLAAAASLATTCYGVCPDSAVIKLDPQARIRMGRSVRTGMPMRRDRDGA